MFGRRSDRGGFRGRSETNKLDRMNMITPAMNMMKSIHLVHRAVIMFILSRLFCSSLQEPTALTGFT
jgi:hypothetical protein